MERNLYGRGTVSILCHQSPMLGVDRARDSLDLVPPVPHVRVDRARDSLDLVP